MQVLPRLSPVRASRPIPHFPRMSKQEMRDVVCSTRTNKKSCAAGRPRRSAVFPSPGRYAVFPCADAALSLRAPTLRCLSVVGTGLAPPDVNLGVVQTVEQTRIRVAVESSFLEIHGKKPGQGKPNQPAQYSALSGDHHRHAIRHRHVKRHHQNYAARKNCGSAPNWSVTAQSMTAPPDSLTAEANSSGSGPSTIVMAARTFDHRWNRNAVFRHSAQNPPRADDSTGSSLRLASNCCYARHWSCLRHGSLRCQNLAGHARGPWKYLGLPRRGHHWCRCSVRDCLPRRSSKAAGFVRVGSGERSRLYCWVTSCDPLLVRPSGPQTSCWCSSCAPAYGQPPLRERCAPRPSGFPPTLAVFDAQSCSPRRTNSGEWD
jgi:hypothetical protein